VPPQSRTSMMQKAKVLHQNAVGIAVVECAPNDAMLPPNVTDFYQ
jgi:hypothetical protein